MPEQPQIQEHIDDGVQAPYAPELFDCDQSAQGIAGLHAIDDDQLQQFHDEGYLLVRHVFTSAQVDAARAGLTDLIFKRGSGSGAYEICFELAAGDHLAELTGMQREYAVRKLANFKGVDERLDAMLYDPGILQTLERMGLRDPQEFQSMALIKPPGGREKPWHQDRAYFDTPMEDPIIGVWIALDDATVENGCMFVRPRWHEPVVHFKRRDWQICDKDALAMSVQPVAVPMQSGDVLFFDSLLPHGTPTNLSDRRRRALQFHYAATDVRQITEAQRMEIFGEEGKDVTC